MTAPNSMNESAAPPKQVSGLQQKNTEIRESCSLGSEPLLAPLLEVPQSARKMPHGQQRAPGTGITIPKCIMIRALIGCHL